MNCTELKMESSRETNQISLIISCMTQEIDKAWQNSNQAPRNMYPSGGMGACMDHCTEQSWKVWR